MEGKNNWRLDKYKGRPERGYSYEEKKYIEREPTIPERLYRQIPVTDLYLLWRDKELPVQVGGGTMTKVESGSVGNYWFPKPVSFNRDLEVYLITEPAKWKDGPQYLQESDMSFKSDTATEAFGGASTFGSFGSAMASVPEIHTGNRVRLDELTVCLKSSTHESIKDKIQALEGLAKAGDELTNEEDRIARWIGELHDREIGRPEGEVGIRETTDRQLAYGKQWIKKENNLKQLKEFYEWVLQLPVMKSADMPADIDDIVFNPDKEKKNEEKFVSFYNSIKKKDVS